MKRLIKILLFLIINLLFILPKTSFSQTKEELEKKREEKEKEISFTKKLIAETNEKQKNTLNYLNLLNRQITSRQDLINTVKQEIAHLNSSISSSQDIINALDNDLKSLKDEYVKIVMFSYKTRSLYNKLGFIFSSESFNQAYKRMKFLQYYSRYRKTQIDLIKETQVSLQSKVKELEQQVSEKKDLLKKEENEKNELEKDLKSKQTLIDQLQDKEKQLKKELKEKEKTAKQLEKAIQEIIKREIEASKKSSGSSTYALTPEAKLISGEFEKNKSNLPWPVQRGFISEKFGRQPHPTLKGVMINNSGIDIRTEKGAMARAVFEGEVRNVINLRGAGLAVLIRHGGYFTLYSNLEEVFVNPGQKVEAKQEIGKILTDPTSGETELQFQVWKVTENEPRKLDPEDWILKQ